MSKALTRTVIERAIQAYIDKNKRESGNVTLSSVPVSRGSDEPAFMGTTEDYSVARVSEVVESLSDVERAIVQALSDGWTYRETGKALGISHVRVGQIVQRIRGRLTKE